MPDYAKFKVGAVQYPLTSATTNSLLRDADPAIHFAIDFWTAVLRTHLNGRAVAEAARCAVPIANVVASTADFDVAPHLLEHPELRPPVLAVYRISTSFRDRTMVWEHESSEWGVTYVLPVMHALGANKVRPLLKAIADVLCNRTSQGFDPTYASGARVWGSSYANLESIGFTRATFGRLEDANGLVFPTLDMRATVKERTMPPTGDLVALQGADVNVQVHDAAVGTTVDAVAQGKSDDLPPDPG